MHEPSPVSLQEQAEDKQQAAIRPVQLGDFIGQTKLQENLSVFIAASRSRAEPIDHIIFHGPPGLGKTTLARIIANEMGVGFRSTLGPILTKAGDLAAILTNIKTHDILFIDEIHRLSIAVEEMLYSAMEDFTVDVMIGEGPAARTLKIDIPPFTLIGATTRFGMLSTPLRTRFGILAHLEFYTKDELCAILQRAADVMGCVLEQGASQEIASRSRGTPRVALRLFRRVRDFALIMGGDERVISAKQGLHALERLGVDAHGLDKGDRRYMEFILHQCNGGPVGIETISSGLSEERDSIEDTIEPYLIQMGLVAKTPRGRMLTKKAKDITLGCYMP